MEQDLDSKFVCKLCNKKYPCGKSLGGHMKSHLVAESDEKFDKNSYFVEFANGQSSYGLRENPKKTWRAVDANNAPLPVQVKLCKQCGKGFPSMKALCGHMACHSDKEKGMKDDNSWTSENQKMVIDSGSDTEEGGDEMRPRTRSSKGKKQKKVIDKCSSFSLANNCSSSVSEIDGQDYEEVAMCLMMLSRDNKGGVNSVVESSDNNSVVLETKSSSLDMRNKNVGVHDDCSPKTGDTKSKDLDFAPAENSDSGYFLDECNKAESDVSVDGRRSYNIREFKKPFASDERRGEEYGYEFRKSLKRKDLRNHEYYDVSYFAGIESSKTAKNGAPSLENSQKRSKYECFNCRKTFKSYQALGGHRPCHKRSNAYYEPAYESGENSLEDSMEFRATNNKSSARISSQDKKLKSKKNKGHACPFCDRVFKNGQALGGHKRSHFIGGHEPIPINRVHVKKPEVPDFIDLNLPAPEEEEDDAHGQFFPCVELQSKHRRAPSTSGSSDDCVMDPGE